MNLSMLFPLVLLTVQQIECGLAPRIYGGQVARSDQYPFMVQLAEERSDGLLHGFCGGSIIKPDIILTAAHCVYGRLANQIFATAGTTRNVADFFVGEDGQMQRGQQWIMAPKYIPPPTSSSKKLDLKYYHDDVALLQLRVKFALNDFVAEIQLPPPYLRINGSVGTAIGWGSTSDLFNVEVPALHLKEAKTSIFVGKKCPIGDELLEMPDDVICSNKDQSLVSNTASVCKGDSGGPLIFKDSRGTYIVGVASYVYNAKEPFCGGPYGGAFFANVQKHLNFIKKGINALSKEDSVWSSTTTSMPMNAK